MPVIFKVWVSSNDASYFMEDHIKRFLVFGFQFFLDPFDLYCGDFFE